MNRFETEYKAVLREIHEQGVWQNNRTNIRTKFIPSAMIRADLREGFPVMGLRELVYKGGLAEAQGFLRGYTNAAEFEALGCRFWTANANEPTLGSDTSPWLSSPHRKGHNDLGKIYGWIWRNWRTSTGEVIDQIEELMKGIARDPESRRHVVATWDPEIVLAKMGALPPCHDSWTINVDITNNLMHMSWRQRSTDIILGTPTNFVCYAFILATIARLQGYQPGILTAHLDNVHYYENHAHAIDPLLERKNTILPTITFASEVPKGTPGAPASSEWLKQIDNSHVHISNYIPHPKITGLKMAV